MAARADHAVGSGAESEKPGMNLNPKKFWPEYLKHFGHQPNPLEKQGTETLLSLISSDPQITRLEWAAYILATIRNECGANMQPKKEIKDKPGGEVWEKYQRHYWPSGYYGRGYSQLTWKENYQDFSDLLYHDNRLVKNPDLVMQPEVGYKILATGMVQGLFRRRSKTSAFKLSDFFNDAKEDEINARQIVNGIGGTAYQWALRVAGYYREYKPCLQAALEV
jgi:putative chitinase